MSGEELESVPRKRCPKCSTVYEGPEVAKMFSCDQCGNGYLSILTPKKPTSDDPSHRLPRSGGETITHARDNF